MHRSDFLPDRDEEARNPGSHTASCSSFMGVQGSYHGLQPGFQLP